MIDRPRMVVVEENREETHIVKTVSFMDLEGAPAALAGQFLMVWIPGIDEIPMSLTTVGENKAFAVHNKGPATGALHSLVKGDMVGVRGPYGNGFHLDKAKKVLAVTGGTGIAPIVPFIEAGGAEFTVITGAQTAKELLYIDRLRKMGCEPIITTDDGTAGRKGFATDAAAELVQAEAFDLVVTCGPEMMMLKLAEACKGTETPCQCSTERYMKCGIGICDSCSMGGLQVCKDGPVFDASELLGLPEFGKWRRTASGKREPLI